MKCLRLMWKGSEVKDHDQGSNLKGSNLKGRVIFLIEGLTLLQPW